MITTDLVKLGALVFTAVSFVVIGDTAGKILTIAGVAPFFIAWTRFALAAVMLLPFSGLKRAEWRGFFDWRVFGRAALVAAGIASILTALRTEPIANAFGALFIGPIVAYILAIIFLGERPSLGRSVLLMIGFIGVLCVVKPGFGMRPGIIYAVLSGCFYGGYLMMTRLVATRYRPRFLLISQLMIGAVMLAPLGLPAMPADMPTSILVFLVVSALGSALGNLLLVMANRRAEASLIAPLIYTQLISATLAGLVFFAEWPDMTAFVGLSLILISGLGSLIVAQMRKSDNTG